LCGINFREAKLGKEFEDGKYSEKKVEQTDLAGPLAPFGSSEKT
jgi:hypothetical protein